MKKLIKIIFKPVTIMFILLLVSSGTAFYFYQKSQTLNPQKASIENEEDAEKLIAKVNRLIVMPSEDVPSIATVSDLEKLKGQAFFAKAKVGDKVLIYSQAQKAILYRESEDRIIEIAPIISNAPDL